MRRAKTAGNQFKAQAKSFGRLITDDIRHGDLTQNWLQDFKDIYHFYLDRETKKRLQKMGEIKRGLFIVFWLIKSLFLKLAPARRILLLAGLLLLTNAVSVVTPVTNTNWLGLVAILTVLAFELKDKLLAHSELAVGRKVQKALLPTEHPHLDGWELWLYTRPANEVGGDLVDFIELDDDAMGLTLGDVAGKGLGAALLMAKLQATIRALAPDMSSLQKLGEKVNAIICRDGLKNRFASLVYLEIKADSGEVRYLNAGHMPPVQLSKNGLTELSLRGPALGMTPEASYIEGSAELKSGDWLLIYSDGLTEARNQQDQFWGEDQLRTLLRSRSWSSVETLGRALIDAVDNFQDKAPPSDDLSLILIRRSSRSE